MVQPYIVDALRYLRVTQEGQQWAANLYANVFLMEHWGKDSLLRSVDTARRPHARRLTLPCLILTKVQPPP
jgi:hypothetical protein